MSTLSVVLPRASKRVNPRRSASAATDRAELSATATVSARPADDFSGLDRLDREELDDDEPAQ